MLVGIPPRPSRRETRFPTSAANASAALARRGLSSVRRGGNGGLKRRVRHERAPGSDRRYGIKTAIQPLSPNRNLFEILMIVYSLGLNHQRSNSRGSYLSWFGIYLLFYSISCSDCHIGSLTVILRGSFYPFWVLKSFHVLAYLLGGGGCNPGQRC